jgi:hypothetical protein
MSRRPDVPVNREERLRKRRRFPVSDAGAAGKGGLQLAVECSHDRHELQSFRAPCLNRVSLTGVANRFIRIGLIPNQDRFCNGTALSPGPRSRKHPSYLKISRLGSCVSRRLPANRDFHQTFVRLTTCQPIDRLTLKEKGRIECLFVKFA